MILWREYFNKPLTSELPPNSDRLMEVSEPSKSEPSNDGIKLIEGTMIEEVQEDSPSEEVVEAIKITKREISWT